MMEKTAEQVRQKATQIGDRFRTDWLHRRNDAVCSKARIAASRGRVGAGMHGKTNLQLPNYQPSRQTVPPRCKSTLSINARM